MSGRWKTSTRRQQLPPDWPAIVATVRARSRGRCEDLDPDGKRCWRLANGGVDHALARDNHDPMHLRDLCHHHHTLKTQAEARAARHTLARPAEQHPGLR